MEDGRFREDLYYRVNVIQLRIPPLRERREDTVWLAHRFLEEHSAKRRVATAFSFTAAAERAMLSYPWPGNVRELKHCIERACIPSDRPQLGPEMLMGESRTRACGASPSGASASGDTLLAYLEACEKGYIEDGLTTRHGRVGDTAEFLGISRKSLWERMRRHGIVRQAVGVEQG